VWEAGTSKRKGPPRNPGSGDYQGLVPFADLAKKTIDDPLMEKRLLDQGYECFLQQLCLNERVHAQDLKGRIIEVYRQCYQQDSKNPESVVTDFVANYPQLAFDAPWLKALVETHAASRDFRRNGPRSRLFRAMTTGFRRVANPGPRFNQSMRDARLEAARFALPDIRKDLSEWEATLERSAKPPQEWIKEQAAAKATKLAAHPRLEPCKQQLTDLLSQGKHYQAAIFVAAKIYGVRERALQSRKS